MGMRWKWKKVKEIEGCPECGSPLLVIHNDSNREAWAECEDCEAETPLSFVEDFGEKYFIYPGSGSMAVLDKEQFEHWRENFKGQMVDSYRELGLDTYLVVKGVVESGRR